LTVSAVAVLIPVLGLGERDSSSAGGAKGGFWQEDAIGRLTTFGGHAIRDRSTPDNESIAVRLPPCDGVLSFLVSLSGCAELRELDWVEHVGDRREHVKDREAAAIGHLRGLRRLSLGGTGVTDSGLACFNNLNRLETLVLWGTGISDTGLEHLAALPSLRVLDISGTTVTCEGLNHLEDCETLRVLYATCNAKLSLSAFGKLKQLRELYLMFTQVSDDGMLALASIPQLWTLSIGGQSRGVITNTGFSHLADLTALRLLHLSSADISDAGLTPLDQMPWLESLAIGDSRITDVGVTKLLKLRRLRELDLNDSDITGLTIGQLALLPMLRRLDLSGTKLSDERIPQLSTLGNLDELGVFRTQLTSKGVEALREALPDTRILTKGRCSFPADRIPVP